MPKRRGSGMVRGWKGSKEPNIRRYLTRANSTKMHPYNIPDNSRCFENPSDSHCDDRNVPNQQSSLLSSLQLNRKSNATQPMKLGKKSGRCINTITPERTNDHDNSEAVSVLTEPMPIMRDDKRTPSRKIKRVPDVLPKHVRQKLSLNATLRQSVVIGETVRNSPVLRGLKHVRRNLFSGAESQEELKKAALKFEEQKKKRVEALRMLIRASESQQKVYQNKLSPKLQPKSTACEAKKNNTVKRQVIADLLTVNGKRYNPHSAASAYWVTDRLYDKVIKAVKLKHKLNARRVVEEIVKSMCDLVKQITKSKKNEVRLLEDLRRVLYRAGLIKSFMDYITFSYEYLPELFILKGVPMLRAFGEENLPLPEDLFADLNL